MCEYALQLGLGNTAKTIILLMISGIIYFISETQKLAFILVIDDNRQHKGQLKN